MGIEEKARRTRKDRTTVEAIIANKTDVMLANVAEILMPSDMYRWDP